MSDFFQFIGEQWLLFTALLVSVFFLILHESQKAGKSFSPAQLVNAVNSQSAIVVDIRDAEEFKVGHITDAINIPAAKLAERLVELEKHKSKPIVIVCAYGHSSGSAVKTLTESGFDDVARLAGGMAEWSASQMPTVKA